jgi:hypothetical protein
LRICHRALETSPETTTSVILACARLQNFIIDNDWGDPYKSDSEDTNDPCELEDDTNEEEDTSLPDQFGNNEKMQRATFGEGYLPTIDDFCSQEDSSVLRQLIVDNIDKKGLSRPNYNVSQNFERYEDINKM